MCPQADVVSVVPLARSRNKFCARSAQSLQTFVAYKTLKLRILRIGPLAHTVRDVSSIDANCNSSAILIASHPLMNRHRVDIYTCNVWCDTDHQLRACCITWNEKPLHNTSMQSMLGYTASRFVSQLREWPHFRGRARLEITPIL